MPEYPFTSLRSWIDVLEKKGELLRNIEEVDLTGDVSAFSQWVGSFGGPAMLHEQVKGFPDWRVFTDGLTTPKRQARVFGFPETGLSRQLAQTLATLKPMKPRVVKDGPCKELKLFGDEIDLVKFPIPYSGEFSLPPFICAGISNVMDRETGWQNSGIRRFQLKGKRELTNLIVATQHEGMIFSKYINQGREMPISIVVGADPLYYLCSIMPAPLQASEMDYWGPFAGQPLDVVVSETSEILVPAGAEIIIEGRIDTAYRELEGVFSEFPGYYSGYNMCPVIKVEAVTMRRDAIYMHMYQGVPASEGTNLNALLTEMEIYRQVKPLIPALEDVAVLSTSFITVAMSLNIDDLRRNPGIAKQAAMAVKTVKAGSMVKNVFVLDSTVDPHNVQEVLWSLSVKFQPARDIDVVEGTSGFYLDPSEPWLGRGPGRSSFAIYDCTEKPPPYDEGYKRGVAYPRQRSMDRVRQFWEAKSVRDRQ